MKILKIATHWTPEEADCIFTFLEELQSMIWEIYGEDLAQIYQQLGEQQQSMEHELRKHLTMKFHFKP